MFRSFIGRVFGSSEQVGKVTDAVISTGDALFYTEEEKAQASMKQLEWILEFHKASAGSNLARRMLAVMLVFVFLLLVITCAVFICFDNAVVSAALFELIGDTLVAPVGLIISFYFASGMVRDFVGKKKGPSEN